MLSHDLAHALLARRNNNVRIEVLIDDDPTGNRAIWTTPIQLRDDLTGSAHRVGADELIGYDSNLDAVLIRAGLICTDGDDQ